MSREHHSLLSLITYFKICVHFGVRRSGDGVGNRRKQGTSQSQGFGMAVKLGKLLFKGAHFPFPHNRGIWESFKCNICADYMRKGDFFPPMVLNKDLG